MKSQDVFLKLPTVTGLLPSTFQTALNQSVRECACVCVCVCLGGREVV